MIVYNFINSNDPGEITISISEIRPQTEVEISTPIAPEILRQQMLAGKLHVWLYALVERLQKNESKLTANGAKFVKDNKAEIQIQFSAKTPDVLEKLKKLGFEFVGERNKNTIVGKIAVEKIANLAEIAEILYVLPELK